MAPSESRPAFRLPWQSGQASEPGSETTSPTATVDVPAWPSHDLVRHDPRTEAMATATPAAELSTAETATAETTAETWLETAHEAMTARAEAATSEAAT